MHGQTSGGSACIYLILQGNALVGAGCRAMGGKLGRYGAGDAQRLPRVYAVNARRHGAFRWRFTPRQFVPYDRSMKCPVCRTDFVALRADAQYCSSNCRSHAYRIRQRTAAHQAESAEAQKDPQAKRLRKRTEGLTAAAGSGRTPRISLEQQVLSQAPPNADRYRLVLGMTTDAAAIDFAPPDTAWNLIPFEPPSDLRLVPGHVYRIIWIDRKGRPVKPLELDPAPALHFFLGQPDAEVSAQQVENRWQAKNNFQLRRQIEELERQLHRARTRHQRTKRVLKIVKSESERTIQALSDRLRDNSSDGLLKAAVPALLAFWAGKEWPSVEAFIVAMVSKLKQEVRAPAKSAEPADTDRGEKKADEKPTSAQHSPNRSNMDLGASPEPFQAVDADELGPTESVPATNPAGPTGAANSGTRDREQPSPNAAPANTLLADHAEEAMRAAPPNLHPLQRHQENSDPLPATTARPLDDTTAELLARIESTPESAGMSLELKKRLTEIVTSVGAESAELYHAGGIPETARRWPSNIAASSRASHLGATNASSSRADGGLLSLPTQERASRSN